VLYTGCQAAVVVGCNSQQVQETKKAKQQLLATFIRCFPARYEAGAGECSKKLRDKIMQMLGHK
jgi:hypothetical protein